MNKAQELTTILKRLNQGDDPERVKAEAREFLKTIGPADLSIAEQNLIDEGLSVDDLQGLCQVHLDVLHEQVEQMRAALPAGHVVATMVSEHDLILGFLDELERINGEIQKMDAYDPSREEFKTLAHIAEHLVETEPHHQREQDVLFPELEKRGVHGPPTVMRREHEQLRPRKQQLKELVEAAGDGDFGAFKQRLYELVVYLAPTLRDHIAKENNILYPTALQIIEDAKVWDRLKAACDEIGYCCFTPQA
jgi:hypothetical protein